MNDAMNVIPKNRRMLDAFLRTLNGEQTGQIVWTADINYWLDGQRQSGIARPEWDTEEGYLKLHRELGILPYYYYQKFWTAEPRYDDSIQLIETQDHDQHTRVFRTPVGELREESVYSPMSCSLGITKHLVESENDLDILLYLLRHRHLEPANLADWRERSHLWQTYDGLPCIGLPRSPLAALFVEWAGVQNASYLFLDCPDKVAEALQMFEQQEVPILDAICELAPPLVHFPDNLCSECSTRLYDKHMAGTHRRRIERLHAAGIKCAIHLDGAVRGLLPKLASSGFDAVEALTPKPAGDLDIQEIKSLVDDDATILWGGVPGIMFSSPYDWDQMESHVHRLIECWGDHPFIMGVADQVPPDGNIAFCRNIANLVQQS